MPDYRLETAMHALSRDKVARIAFRSDPQAVLADQPLSEEERDILAGFDLQAMLDRGVNPLLIQGFWVSIHGGPSLGEFVARMNNCRSEYHG